MSTEETSPWVRMDLKLWEPLVTGRVPIIYRKNSLLFYQGDLPELVYIVKSGRVRITCYQKSGAEKQLYIAEQGALFGEASCLLHRSHSTSAVAIVDSVVYCIPFRELEAGMQANWPLAQLVMQTISRKNALLQQQVVELSFSDALQRIAQVLVNLGREYGKSGAEGLSISIRFTQQDVANLTNTSRVTVSNMFHFLAARGVLSKQNGHFVLREPDVLRQMADGVYSDELR